MKLLQLFMVTLLFMSTNLVNAQEPVIVTPSNEHGGSEGGDHPKAPVQIPTVYYEDYVLTFDSSCIGCTIELVQDDEVVFTGVVNANGEVEIPDTLVGLIELRIYRGGTSFVGEFEP